uniref:hypothetical protein n=1 Tax=Caballeronia terrestris TaxID=1226301 RepID=UPI000AA52F03
RCQILELGFEPIDLPLQLLGFTTEVPPIRMPAVMRGFEALMGPADGFAVESIRHDRQIQRDLVMYEKSEGGHLIRL